MALSVSPYGLPAPPTGEAKGACTNSPWCILNGILRTAKPLRRDAPSSPFRGGWTRLPGGGSWQAERPD